MNNHKIIMWKFYLTIYVIIILSGCTAQDYKSITDFPYKVITIEFAVGKPSTIYGPNLEREILFNRTTPLSQSIDGWLNEEDCLLMNESSMSYHGYLYYNHLYKIDLNKNILDTIFKSNANDGERISQSVIDSKDSLVLIRLHKRKVTNGSEIEESLNQSFHAPVKIIIKNLKDGSLNKTINNICNQNIHLDISFSNIFSPNSEKFIYAINNLRNMFNKYDHLNDSIPEQQNGVFIYDIQKDQIKRIDSIGENAIWSISQDLIFYRKFNTIMCYHNITETSEVFFPSIKGDELIEIKLTPDDKYIYILAKKKSKYKQKLVNIETKEQLDLRRFCEFSFYWKH